MAEAVAGPIPGNYHKKVAAACGRPPRLDQRRDLGFQLGDLAFHRCKQCLGLPLQERDILSLGAVTQSRAVLDQPGATGAGSP